MYTFLSLHAVFAASFVESGNNTSQISTSQIESQHMYILLEEIDAFWSAVYFLKLPILTSDFHDEVWVIYLE